MNKNIDPLEFINVLRDSDDYIKIIYINGGCYNLYKILKLLYADAVAYKVKMNNHDNYYSHVVTKIGGDFYDITGIVNDKYFDRQKIRDAELDEIKNWRFSKSKRLFKRCKYCQEEIYF